VSKTSSQTLQSTFLLVLFIAACVKLRMDFRVQPMKHEKNKYISFNKHFWQSKDLPVNILPKTSLRDTS
jgi:hypothetical protein